MHRGLPPAPLALLVALLAACGGQPPPPPALVEPPGADWQYPGIPDTRRGLLALAVPCAFDAASGTMTVKVQAGELAVLSVGAGGTVDANDTPCGTARTGNVRRIDVLEDPAATGDQTVILDYAGGLFALGTSTAGSGVHVDLGATGADGLKLQGSVNADSFVLGTLGVAVNSDNWVDVAIANGANLKVVVSTGAGNDKVSGAGGQGTGAAYPYPLDIYGGAGNDTLTGGAAADLIFGGDGDDLITASPGGDLVQGENGNDTFFAGTASSTGTAWFGGPGTDVMDYGKRTRPLTVVMDATLAGTTPAGTFSGEPGEQDLVGQDLEVLNCGSGGDTITGSPNGTTINGGAGNDTFLARATASAGSDRWNGGGGVDTVDFSARGGPLTITLDGVSSSGGPGEQIVIGADVENAIGGSGDDVITGNARDNRLEGGPGNDTLYGLDGDDVLVGGAGNDTMFGGNGDDTFLFLSAAGAEGNDVVNCGAGSFDTLDYGARTAAVTIDLAWHSTATGSAGESTTIGGGTGTAAERPDLADACEVAFGGSGTNTLLGNSLDNILDGNSASGAASADGRGGVDVCINAATQVSCEL